jgi:hypothetical protein
MSAGPPLAIAFRGEFARSSKGLECVVGAGANRLHDPQIKSRLAPLETLKELSNFSRQVCRTQHPAAD